MDHHGVFGCSRCHAPQHRRLRLFLLWAGQTSASKLLQARRPVGSGGCSDGGTWVEAAPPGTSTRITPQDFASGVAGATRARAGAYRRAAGDTRIAASGLVGRHDRQHQRRCWGPASRRRGRARTVGSEVVCRCPTERCGIGAEWAGQRTTRAGGTLTRACGTFARACGGRSCGRGRRCQRLHPGADPHAIAAAEWTREQKTDSPVIADHRLSFHLSHSVTVFTTTVPGLIGPNLGLFRTLTSNFTFFLIRCRFQITL